MSEDSPITDQLPPVVQEWLQTTSEATERVLREEPTMEHVLLIAFLITGIYMFIGTFDFSPRVAEFPRLMSGATIILSTLLLARNYLYYLGPLLIGGLGAYALATGSMSYIDDGNGLFSIVLGVVLLVPAIFFRDWLRSTVEDFVAEPMQVLGSGEVSDAVEGIGDEQEETEAEEEREEEEERQGAFYVYEIDDWRGPVVTGILCASYMLVGFIIGMLYATPLFVAAWAMWVGMDRLRSAVAILLSFLVALAFYEFITNDVGEGWLTGWELPVPTDFLAIWTYYGEHVLAVVLG